MHGKEAAMLLCRYSCNKDGKTRTYYTLVESVRTDAGPRQYIAAYLGELNHNEQKRWQRAVSIYNRQGDCLERYLFPRRRSSPGFRRI
jgi:hypothetical protein